MLFLSFTQLTKFTTIIMFLNHIILLKPDIRQDLIVDLNLNWWAEVRGCLKSACKMAKRAFRFLAFSFMYLLIFYKSFKQTLLSASHYIQNEFLKKNHAVWPNQLFWPVKTSSSISTIYSTIILYVFTPLDIFVFYCLTISNHCGFCFFDTDQQKKYVLFQIENNSLQSDLNL